MEVTRLLLLVLPQEFVELDDNVTKVSPFVFTPIQTYDQTPSALGLDHGGLGGDQSRILGCKDELVFSVIAVVRHIYYIWGRRPSEWSRVG